MKTPRLKFSGVVSRAALLILIQLLCYQLVSAQSQVSGIVKDETGTPMPSVIIQIKGKSASTTTDVNGKFIINAAKSDILEFRFVGYQPREIPVGDKSTINISLEPDNKSLSEVIVTGYSKQSKHDVTGAASTISASIIQQAPVTTVEQAIQGRVAGVTVDGQGGPGNAQTIRIRGIGTLGNNDPLYVIDGVQVRVGTAGGSQNISNLLNPNDIESLTILKDPSLTTLYGANGRNGVIVITTKTGKMGAPRLDYNGYVGVENPRNLPKTITPQQQADALYGSYINAGMAVPGSFTSLFGTGTTPVLPDYIIETGSGNIGVMAGDPRANPSLYNQNSYRILQANKAGTNWWSAMFKSAMTQNHNLSLSGATDKSNYAITFGYLNDQGTLLNSYFERYSLRANTSFQVKPWLKVGENFEFSYTSQNTENRGATNDISELYILSPILPKYDISGNPAGTNGLSTLGLTGNPYTARVNSLADKNYNQSVVGTAYADATIIKGLTYTNQIGFQFFPNEFHAYSPVQPQEPIPGTTNLFTEGGSYSTDWRWLNKLAYTTTINGIHNISAFAGYEMQEFAFRSYGAGTGNIGYPSSNTEYLGNGNTGTDAAYLNTVSGTGNKTTSLSYFANVTYSLLDKYLFTASGRRDGTSIVADHYGSFGAVSAGWRISKEDFLKDVSWLNDLKLRASYGGSGNNASLSAGQYLTTLSGGNFGNYDLGGTNTTSMSGYYTYQLGNPYLHWETNVTTNLGFDASLFHNSLSIAFSWYDKQTKGLIFAPPSSGTEGSALSPYLNTMDFSNKGLELELSYNSHIGEVKYDMGFNITTDKNRVNYINGIQGTFFQGGQYGSNGANYLPRVHSYKFCFHMIPGKTHQHQNSCKKHSDCSHR